MGLMYQSDPTFSRVILLTCFTMLKEEKSLGLYILYIITSQFFSLIHLFSEIAQKNHHK